MITYSRLALCVLLLTVRTVPAQDSTNAKPRAAVHFELAADRSAEVRAYMRQVQSQFDQINDSSWYRVAFVATLSEIRPLKPEDKVIGQLRSGQTDVAVLRVRALGQQKGIEFKESSVIVCAIGKHRTLWENWLRQKAEMVFEYNRIGATEFVLKFGC